MIRYHNLNGQIVESDQARILVSDVGLLRGYGIFDFFPIVGGRPLFEDDYFNRFYRSADLLRIPVPIDRTELRDRVVDLAARNQIRKGYTKLVLTGGYSADGFTPGESNLFILQHEDIANDPISYENGVAVILQRYLKDQPAIKTLNYANILKNRDLLSREKAMDLLYHDGRNIRETSRANFFIINHQGQILTTEEDVLSGVTRRHVIKVARSEGYTVIEGPLPLYLLTQATECFITSTTKGVLPVTRINDYSIGSGKAGDICRRLQEAYLDYCENYAKEHFLI